MRIHTRGGRVRAKPATRRFTPCGVRAVVQTLRAGHAPARRLRHRPRRADTALLLPPQLPALDGDNDARRRDRRVQHRRAGRHERRPRAARRLADTDADLLPGAGEAVRVRSQLVKEAYEQGDGARKLFNRYVHTVIVVGSHSTACKRVHRLDQRFYKWLLMSSDGTGSDEVNLTHEYLAVMLGVRRAGVTEAAVKAKQEGLIDYHRGRIRILDRGDGGAGLRVPRADEGGVRAAVRGREQPYP